MKNFLTQLTVVLLLISTFQPKIAKAEEDADWMVGGKMAVVWVLTGIPQISRHQCCIESDPDNACNLGNQDSINCDAWRANNGFLLTFPNPE
jgi:hypothetical protein